MKSHRYEKISMWTYLVSVCRQHLAGSTKDIYKKNWIDFNKNGVKDVYEDPAAPY